MATATVPPAAAGGFDRKYELRVLVLLGLAFGFAYFDRMALTFLAPLWDGPPLFPGIGYDAGV